VKIDRAPNDIASIVVEVLNPNECLADARNLELLYLIFRHVVSPNAKALRLARNVSIHPETFGLDLVDDQIADIGDGAEFAIFASRVLRFDHVGRDIFKRSTTCVALFFLPAIPCSSVGELVEVVR